MGGSRNSGRKVGGTGLGAVGRAPSSVCFFARPAAAYGDPLSHLSSSPAAAATTAHVMRTAGAGGGGDAASSGAPKVATLEPLRLHRRDVSGLPTDGRVRFDAIAWRPSRGLRRRRGRRAGVETSHEGTEEKWCFD